MRRFLPVLVVMLLVASLPARADDATFHGSLGATPLNQPIVGMASTPSGDGYWLVAADGGVFAFGDARFHGSTGSLTLASPIVGMASTPSGDGYWLVAADGGVFSFGDAGFFGSATGASGRFVGMVATASGAGYWLARADGAVHPFGDASTFAGPASVISELRRPIVGVAAPPDREGLWLAAGDGSVFAFGVPFHGSAAGVPLAHPVVGMASTPTGAGYWLVAADGGIFSFGDATFFGSTGAIRLNRPIVGMTASPDAGYWFVASDGGVFTFSPADAAPSSACTIFPADNPWNTDVSTRPVHERSAAWVSSIGDGNLHPDFGTFWEGGPIGIPYVEVPAGQPGVPVTFEYDDESDHGLYPIPRDAPIEGGRDAEGDRHVLVLSRSECRLYELFYAFPNADGSWHAGSGAIFDLQSNALRPDYWTSADAAGLPVFAGLVRYDEVAAGSIGHALRFTASTTQRGFIHPATHFASSNTDPDVPPMGARFRMKATHDCSPFTREVQVICAAMKRYGMFLADNGSDWFVSGAHDPRWDDGALGDLKRIPGTAFEAVETGPVIR